MPAKKSSSSSKAKGSKGKAKRAPNSYMVFVKEQRAGVAAANPDLKVTEIAKLLGEKWRNLSDAEKKKYTDKAAKGAAKNA